ncbi:MULTISPECIES: gas vesicle protein GvpO [Nocardia]|uniref:gas vesicle protein GvpO n=1 Tax=Nocardia TaxID=1817 RepID=UPI000BF172A7|nr:MULTISPECIES: gas vesicle protein [Nocardia]MBF6184098.1 gas vesicle protein [Nocardia farcinica]MBF6293042.1 gas vesicle protein [Nocardia farcinica]MBF6309941.1 gas vesicle protein [Nocardia farcinica]MBF6358939.1 gas vesicle protein [Nocardia farcinica]MBF6379337.1 gas vesicle protein [Nocardia farcinica]
MTDTESGRPALGAGQAGTVATRQLAELISKPIEAATSSEPTEAGWLVEVEVLEDRRIPPSADMLALYEVELDLDGNLLAYRRVRRYSRGSTDIGERNLR